MGPLSYLAFYKLVFSETCFIGFKISVQRKKNIGKKLGYAKSNSSLYCRTYQSLNCWHAFQITKKEVQISEFTKLLGPWIRFPDIPIDISGNSVLKNITLG